MESDDMTASSSSGSFSRRPCADSAWPGLWGSWIKLEDGRDRDRCLPPTLIFTSLSLATMAAELPIPIFTSLDKALPDLETAAAQA